MEEIIQFLAGILNREFIRAVFSNPRVKDNVVKAKLRPMEQKGELLFQLESFTKTQAFHKNLTVEETKDELAKLLEEFCQVQVETVSEDITVLISKKGKATIKRKRKKVQAKVADLSHNRKKKYILEEGIVVPFLQDLGVMTQDGKIVRTKMDKFRQINRFLEFVEDILPQLDKDRELTLLDFGCGKSYLTFAMYYYLKELKGYNIRVIGLDLKEDVIEHCNELRTKYGYDRLDFYVGDIATYKDVDSVDMVVTLHACDTATGYALAKAVAWGAKVILSVPCCQHEANRTISSTLLSPVMDYGILKERMSAIITDAARANMLKARGYDTQILEFIDMEHTPKNLLIRAVKTGKPDAKAYEEVQNMSRVLNIDLTLKKLLED